MRGARIEPGTMRDYEALARFHYLAGAPATCARVLRAVGASGEVAGVLVVSMPTLDGSWRDVAWPGRYRSGDRRRDARTLNREVRTISRVVVEPRYRAAGLARRLVRAYLDDALTPATEAVATMGLVCPFFERAGMVPIRLPASPAADRLGRALARAGLRPWDLCWMDRWHAVARDEELLRALRAFARAGKGTRRRAQAGADRLLALAAASPLMGRLAYAHGLGAGG